MDNFYDMVWWEYFVYASIIVQLVYIPLELKAMYASKYCLRMGELERGRADRSIAMRELWLLVIIICGLVLLFNK